MRRQFGVDLAGRRRTKTAVDQTLEPKGHPMNTPYPAALRALANDWYGRAICSLTNDAADPTHRIGGSDCDPDLTANAERLGWEP